MAVVCVEQQDIVLQTDWFLEREDVVTEEVGEHLQCVRNQWSYWNGAGFHRDVGRGHSPSSVCFKCMIVCMKHVLCNSMHIHVHCTHSCTLYMYTYMQLGVFVCHCQVTKVFIG